MAGKPGRPVGSTNDAKNSFTTSLRLALAETDGKGRPDRLRRITERLVREALAGEAWAIQMVADRIEGKVAQAVIGDKNADPIQVVAAVRRIVMEQKDAEPE